MGRITAGVGLISGINSSSIIDQLMALEARPKETLQARIDKTNQIRLAYTGLSTQLTSLKLVGTKLKKPSQFENAATTSSNENVLTATASAGAAVGTYQFRVARLVSSQQVMSKGFVDYDNAKVAAADTNITIELGGGELSTQTALSELRGGAGIRRGIFRITDRSGNTGVIDLSAAVTVDDVLKKINTSLNVSVKASVNGDQIMLTDLSGGAGAMSVQDLADGHAAEDLGLTTDTDASAGTITGSAINFLSVNTTLNQLNDGRGIRRAASGADFTVTVNDGTAIDVTLGPNNKTLGDIINTLNAVSPTKFQASLSADGHGITLTDSTGSGNLTVTAIGTSQAANDLGLLGTSTDGALEGNTILAGINTTLLSSLNGGQGLSLGTISIQDRASGSAVDIDLSGARTVQDVLDAISNDNRLNVTAKLKASGNGIQIIDDSGGSGDLVISGSAGDDLGLSGTYNTTVTSAQGANLQRQWVSENTLLSTYNGGKGVSHGKFKITSSTGTSAIVDLTQGDEVTLGDVIREINSKGVGITASINANGDGLLLTDTAGGSLGMKIEDIDGTAAKDMRIAGAATGTTIDGTFEQTIAVTTTDTLTTLQKKISDLGFGVSANIINDGSGLAPFRLALYATNTGRAGRVTFDASGTNLDASTLVEAQDAAVFLGGTDSPNPLLITASRNQLSGVIRGVTIDLHGVSTDPITLSVTRTADNVVEQLQSFTDTFNEMASRIKELTKFDTETNTRGLLLGDAAVQKIETEMYAVFSSVVATSGKYRILADVGLRIGAEAQLEFDEEKFRAAYADDPDAVKALFTSPQQGITTNTLLAQLNNARGVRTSGNGADFQVTLRDGSTVEVSLAGVDSVSDLIRTISAADDTKLKAELSGTSIKLTDLTGGTGAMTLTAMNGSQALEDLGLTTAASGDTLTGRSLGAVGDPRGRGGGIAYVLEARIAHLIDPLNGVITRENKNLDQKTQSFQDRIEQLDKLLETKRERLTRQFAQMETILASLQNQQTAIGQIQTIKAPSK